MSDVSILAIIAALPVSLYACVVVYQKRKELNGKRQPPPVLAAPEQEKSKRVSIKDIEALGDLRKCGGYDREIQDRRAIGDPAHRTVKVINNIGCIGISGSGKTALMLRLTDSTTDLSLVPATGKSRQYERVHIRSFDKTRRTCSEHIFRFIEWGGEYLVQSQSEMLRMCDPSYREEARNTYHRHGLQALVFVVDMASFQEESHKQIFSRERIRHQTEKYFRPEAIHFLLNEHVLLRLETVILFINKTDCLDNIEHRDIDVLCHEYFDRLICALTARYPRTRIITGSALTGQGLDSLLSTLSACVLPDDVRKDGSLA